MEEKVVTIREFTRNIYKFMKDGGEYVVTKNGKRANVVTIKCHDKEEKADKGRDKREDVVTKAEKVREEKKLDVTNFDTSHQWGWQRDVSKYGCGCVKESGKILCKKHGRA